jgi:hypothetical protein
MSNAEGKQIIEDLRRLLTDVHNSRIESGNAPSKESVHAVHKTLVKLRRFHAKLRQSQKKNDETLQEAKSKLHKARIGRDNAVFLESQCKYLIDQYNNVKCPELDRVKQSLVSNQEFADKHRGEPGFVEYSEDPHQFMMNMLSDELIERRTIENRILAMREDEDKVNLEIQNKQNFINSIQAKLHDLNESIDNLKSAFSISE